LLSLSATVEHMSEPVVHLRLRRPPRNETQPLYNKPLLSERALIENPFIMDVIPFTNAALTLQSRL
jgi:hypothetical protein